MPSTARGAVDRLDDLLLAKLGAMGPPDGGIARASGVHPGRLAQGPDEKSGRAGRAFGFIFTSPLQKSCTPVGERGPRAI
jgi:hypothetical protein